MKKLGDWFSSFILYPLYLFVVIGYYDRGFIGRAHRPAVGGLNGGWWMGGSTIWLIAHGRMYPFPLRGRVWH